MLTVYEDKRHFNAKACHEIREREKERELSCDCYCENCGLSNFSRPSPLQHNVVFCLSSVLTYRLWVWLNGASYRKAVRRSKWTMANRMVTLTWWPMTSRDPARSNLWPNTLTAQYLENIWRQWRNDGVAAASHHARAPTGKGAPAVQEFLMINF